MFAKLSRILVSPANWCGLALATVVLVLKALGLIGVAGLPLALFGYVAASSPAGCGWAFPSSRVRSGRATRSSSATTATRARPWGGRCGRCAGWSSSIRQPAAASLQAKVLDLCTALESLLSQWERSKGALSLQEGFHARHIAISYLPDALKTYLSIPAQYANSRPIHDGKTAVDIFRATLVELEGKVAQLADDSPARTRTRSSPIRSSCTRSSAAPASCRPPAAPPAPWKRVRTMATPDPQPVATAAAPSFQLTPPEVITPVPAAQAPAAVPLSAETASAVDTQVARFIDALMTENVHSTEFKSKLDSAFALGGPRSPTPPG
jgi:hypothetical protein